MVLLQASALPHREGRAWSTVYTTAIQPHWILWPNLRTIDGMPQWISGELFTGGGKKYEDLKEKQVLVFFLRL